MGKGGSGRGRGWRRMGKREVSEGSGGEREGSPCDDVMPCCVGEWRHNDAG